LISQMEVIITSTGRNTTAIILRDENENIKH
jgi:hypothetical protein